MQTQQQKLLRTICFAQATLEEFYERADETGPMALGTRLQRAEHDIEAMQTAEDVFKELNDAVERFTGTRFWTEAMEIAYAPNDFEGYRRVAEYYRRIDRLSLMQAPKA